MKALINYFKKRRKENNAPKEDTEQELRKWCISTISVWECDGQKKINQAQKVYDWVVSGKIPQ